MRYVAIAHSFVIRRVGGLEETPTRARKVRIVIRRVGGLEGVVIATAPALMLSAV